jgi:hypothetical protein
MVSVTSPIPRCAPSCGDAGGDRTAESSRYTLASSRSFFVWSMIFWATWTGTSS